MATRERPVALQWPSPDATSLRKALRNAQRHVVVCLQFVEVQLQTPHQAGRGEGAVSPQAQEKGPVMEYSKI